MRWLAVVFTIFVFVLGRPARAYADDVAPELEAQDLRTKARGELKTLASAMTVAEQKRLVGIYVAFDRDAADPFAQVACDDDGDYVVLISDAMLRLASNVALYEEDVKVEEYALFVARSQVPARRLLPPPGGFFGPRPIGHEERLRDILAFIVARELAHLRAGDLICPKPTMTKESGDDVWTDSEHRFARITASHVYPKARGAQDRDPEAITRLIAAGHSPAGALALLRFFSKLETEPTRFRPTYVTDHPNAGRLEACSAAITAEPKGSRSF